MLGGFALAFMAAFPLAWLMVTIKTLRNILQPIFVLIQCIPMFALAPLMIIWFDWSYTAIVIPTALMIFFPLTMNIYQGFHTVPTYFIDYFRINQATTWQIFFKLRLPWALPHIFAGFRITAAIAGIGAVAGEWAGAQAGLGMLMLESRRGADLEMMFGALFCLAVVSLALYVIAAVCEHLVTSRKFKRPHPHFINACIIGILFTLTSCHSSSNESTSTRIALDWLPNPNHVTLYAGIEKGFFANHDIDLKIMKLHDPGDAIPLLTSGQVELLLTYMPHTMRAMGHGAAVKPIGVLINETLNSLIFLKELGIRSPKDLNGKIIGYCIDGYDTAFLDAVLKINGIIPKEKRNISFDLISTLGAKRVDAIYGAYWNIESENLRAFGVDTEHYRLDELGVPKHYELIIVARNPSFESSDEFSERFKKAMQESIAFSVANPDEAFELYIKANPDKSERTRAWEYDSWQKTMPILAKSQEIDPVIWNSYADWLLDQAILPKTANLELLKINK